MTLASPAPGNGATEERHLGGRSFRASFIGWLTATGTAVLLTALLGAAGATDIGAVDQTRSVMRGTVGMGGAGTLLAILFVGYFCGGCVAGLLARFNGLRQGLGVWSWAVVITGVGAVLGLLAGARSDVLALDSRPRFLFDEGTWSTEAMLTAPAYAVVSLVGAILGGLTGIALHRQVGTNTSRGSRP